MILSEKKSLLINEIKKYKKTAVAFSGGVDSTLLLRICVDALGSENVLALTADCSAFPKRELCEAESLCKKIGAKHINVKINQLEIDGFVENSLLRCYYCKKELLSRLKKTAHDSGFDTLLEGSNADDSKDFRPGEAAIVELGVQSPLKSIGLTKAEIRAFSKELGLPTHSKPSLACLATRINYNEPVTKKKLEMTDKAEEFLLSLGLSQVRVRMHERLARIEVLPSEMQTVLANAEYINSTLKKLGYDFVSLDLGGYETGKMNINIK